MPAAGRRPARSGWRRSTRPPGARAEHVILADLAEGTFPAREAVEPFLALGPGDEPDRGDQDASSPKEMLRFLRVLGSADAGVILVYPTPI